MVIGLARISRLCWIDSKIRQSCTLQFFVSAIHPGRYIDNIKGRLQCRPTSLNFANNKAPRIGHNPRPLPFILYPNNFRPLKFIFMLSSRLFPLSSKWLFPKILQKKSWKDFRLHILATFLAHHSLQNCVAVKIHTKWPLQIINNQHHPLSFKCVLTNSPHIAPRFPDAEHMNREQPFCLSLFVRTYQWTLNIISVGY